jgi:hypothetical protein
MHGAPSHTALSDRPAQARAGGELFTEERSAEVVAVRTAWTGAPPPAGTVPAHQTRPTEQRIRP